MIPRKFANILFSLILSGMMSFLISGIATFRATGLVDHFFSLWIGGWLTAWLIAFPAVMLVAPVARKAVKLLVADE